MDINDKRLRDFFKSATKKELMAIALDLAIAVAHNRNDHSDEAILAILNLTKISVINAGRVMPKHRRANK